MADLIFSREETLRLLLQAKAAGEEGERAMEALVENNLPLVRSIVRKYAFRGLETEDLCQIGSIGLIKAIKNFDPSYKVCFSTYAVPMIAGEIKRFLRDDGMIKVSRSHKELALRIKKARQRLTFRLGREPGIGEIAGELGVEEEEIVLALEAVRPHLSLYAPVGAEDGDLLIRDRVESGVDESALALDRVLVKNALDQLEGRERQIIIQRYFLDRTQTEVANSLGISQVQVSRLETKIIKKLRNAF